MIKITLNNNNYINNKNNYNNNNDINNNNKNNNNFVRLADTNNLQVFFMI